MKNRLLVTVIIPTYNYGRYICEAINSVLSSNFTQREIEIIVVDDGSTDDTLEKVRAYGDRVQYASQKNQGKASATKIGIGYAKGKYIFNLDADDYVAVGIHGFFDFVLIDEARIGENAIAGSSHTAQRGKIDVVQHPCLRVFRNVIAKYSK